MKVLVTGADGFIGRNLRMALGERDDFEALPVGRGTERELAQALSQADAVVHLAGVNRPEDPGQFMLENGDFTAHLCELLLATGRAVPVIFASSIQVDRDNPYGLSKLAAERHLTNYASSSGAGVVIYRLANVFGKWCRPNYNSAVATFCHNIARGLPIDIHDPAAEVRLVYVDDVLGEWLRVLPDVPRGLGFLDAGPVYTVTVGDLARQIEAFRTVRESLITERVGTGLIRALYATYMSYLPMEAFAYGVPAYADPRGVFVEMLKTKDSGQFSYFTARAGVTRGGHYHHTKSEKFLVVKGRARFRFRHLQTGDFHEVITHGEQPKVVETIPGWTHDITNIGDEEMVVMLWASEEFDRARPDTFASAL